MSNFDSLPDEVKANIKGGLKKIRKSFEEAPPELHEELQRAKADLWEAWEAECQSLRDRGIEVPGDHGVLDSWADLSVAIGAEPRSIKNISQLTQLIRGFLCRLKMEKIAGLEACRERPKPEIPKAIKELAKRYEAAYQSFKHAESEMESGLTDRQAFDWLKENGLSAYKLPREYRTWTRYLRKGREHYGEQKNQPRAGRGGRSISTAE
jgi:hypothetical protein